MSDCTYYQQLISGLVDDELTSEERRAVSGHIAGCAECRALFEAFSLVSGAVGMNGEELPEGLHENIMAGVRRSAIIKKNENLKKDGSRRKAAAKKPMPVRQRNRMLIAAACFALVLISAAGIVGELLGQRSAVRQGESLETAAAAIPFAAAAPDANASVASAKAKPETPVTPQKRTYTPVVIPEEKPVDPNAAPDEYAGSAPVKQTQPSAERKAEQPPVQAQAPQETVDLTIGQKQDTQPSGQSQQQTQTQQPVQTQQQTQTQQPVQTQQQTQSQQPVQTQQQTQSQQPVEGTITVEDVETESAAAPAGSGEGAEPEQETNESLPAKFFSMLSPTPKNAAAPAVPQVAEPEETTENTDAVIPAEDAAIPEESETVVADTAESAPTESAKPVTKLPDTRIGKLLKELFDIELPDVEEKSAQKKDAKDSSGDASEAAATPAPSPSASPEKEATGKSAKKLVRQHVDRELTLTGTKAGGELAKLLGVCEEQKSKPEGKADKVWSLTLVLGDTKTELIVSEYGEKLYVTAFDGTKEHKLYLAEAKDKDFDEFIEPYEKAADEAKKDAEAKDAPISGAQDDPNGVVNGFLTAFH